MKIKLIIHERTVASVDMNELPLDLFIPVSLGELDRLKHAPDGYVAGVNSEQNFANTFIGSFNEAAIKGIKAAFYKDDEYCYPIVISGAEVGVSHLLHAATNEWIEMYPDDKVLYSKADNLLEKFGPLIMANCWEPIVESLRTFGLIAIDDFHKQFQRKNVQEFYSQLMPRLANEETQLILGMAFPLSTYKRMNASLRQFLNASRLFEITTLSQKDTVELKRFLSDKTQKSLVDTSLKGAMLYRYAEVENSSGTNISSV